jgi:hypothetical protein
LSVKDVGRFSGRAHDGVVSWRSARSAQRSNIGVSVIPSIAPPDQDGPLPSRCLPDAGESFLIHIHEGRQGH